MNTHTRRLALGLFLGALLFLAGCLEGSAVRTGRYLPPKPPHAPVDVYLDSNPRGPWEEIGRVEAEGTDSFASLHDVILVLEDQTRELGADAVIITDHWGEEEVTTDAYGYTTVRERVRARGIAIHYL